MLRVADMEYSDMLEKAHFVIEVTEHLANLMAEKIPERLHGRFFEEIRVELFK